LGRGIGHFYKNRRFTFGADQVSKSVDRMLALVAMAHSLAPYTKLDDWVKQGISDKYAEQSNKMYRGASSSSITGTQEVLDVYEDLYTRSCPKFISPAPPLLTLPENGEAPVQPNVIDPTKHQANLFLSDVKTLLAVPDMKSFLKLYTSLGTEKLAQLLNRDEEDVVQELAVVKGATRVMKWSAAAAGGSGEATLGLLEGEVENVGEVQFLIQGSTVNITESKRTNPVADYFLRKSIKAKEQVDALRSRPLPVANKAAPQQTPATSSMPSMTSRQSYATPTPAANSASSKKVVWGAVAA